MTDKPDFVLLVSCVDRKGIVAAIAGSIAAQDCNIVTNAQFGDADSGRFFMRIAFTGPEGLTREKFSTAFLSVATAYNLEWQVHDVRVKLRAMIMVSKGGHCLNDLLYRTATRYLPIEITSIVSNHTTWQRRAEHEGIPFFHMPVTPENKAEQEAAMMAMIDEQKVDLIVLARYMQVLSDATCRKLEGRVINIHHSSLPAFKLGDSHISELPTCGDGFEVFEAVSEGNWSGWFGFGITVPSAKFGDDPSSPGEGLGRMGVFLKRGFAFEFWQ